MFWKKRKYKNPPYFFFAFCEPVYATSISPWHIRELTSKGLKLGGGADTKALCGREVAWDLDVAITPHHLTHCCQKCAQKFLLEAKKQK